MRHFRNRHFRNRNFRNRHFDRVAVAPATGQGAEGGDVGTGPDYSQTTVKGIAGPQRPQRRPRIIWIGDEPSEEDEELVLVLAALLR